MSTIEITDSEWEVMRVLWSQKESSSREVITILERKTSWRPTTIKTLLARLVKKELVGTTREGNRYLYRPLVSEREAWREASQQLFGNICAQKMGKKIALLIEESLLSHDDLTLIQSALEAKSAEAVEFVPCDCIPGQCNCEPGSCDASRPHSFTKEEA